jgi:hypothetical protein
MVLDEGKTERQPWSITRLNGIITDCIDGVNQRVWLHVRAIADLTGYNISPSAHIRPLSSEDPQPLIKSFELAESLKEAINQVDIALNNLGHDLNPEYYEAAYEAAKKNPSEI